MGSSTRALVTLLWNLDEFVTLRPSASTTSMASAGQATYIIQLADSVRQSFAFQVSLACNTHSGPTSSVSGALADPAPAPPPSTTSAGPVNKPAGCAIPPWKRCSRHRGRLLGDDPVAAELHSRGALESGEQLVDGQLPDSGSSIWPAILIGVHGGGNIWPRRILATGCSARSLARQGRHSRRVDSSTLSSASCRSKPFPSSPSDARHRCCRSSTLAVPRTGHS